MKNFIEIPTTQLVPADWNYKKEDPKLQKKLVKNIQKNGCIENLIVRELTSDPPSYEIVNGNHRYQALKELNIETVMCYNLGAVNLAFAKKIAVETNETRFFKDEINFAKLMNELVQTYTPLDLSETLNFTEKEIDNYAKLTEFQFQLFQSGGKKKEKVDKKPKQESGFKTFLLSEGTEVLYTAAFKLFKNKAQELLPPDLWEEWKNSDFAQNNKVEELFFMVLLHKYIDTNN